MQAKGGSCKVLNQREWTEGGVRVAVGGGGMGCRGPKEKYAVLAEMLAA